ncbi:MAG TPA: hypothetical protein VEJ45_03810 [Candidatus Acidoferrales bacterium]|nr:hypothetical protein [Candidatus Acidoferrales bacterium]
MLWREMISLRAVAAEWRSSVPGYRGDWGDFGTAGDSGEEPGGRAAGLKKWWSVLGAA